MTPTRSAIARELRLIAAKANDDSTEVLSVWQYLGCGYLNPGDVLLEAGGEASLSAAREALLDLRRNPP
jgi:hypothetical protein